MVRRSSQKFFCFLSHFTLRLSLLTGLQNRFDKLSHPSPVSFDNILSGKERRWMISINKSNLNDKKNERVNKFSNGTLLYTMNWKNVKKKDAKKLQNDKFHRDVEVIDK